MEGLVQHSGKGRGALVSCGQNIPGGKGGVMADCCKEWMAALAEVLNQGPPRCCKGLKTLKRENERLKADVGVLDRVRGLVGSTV